MEFIVEFIVEGSHSSTLGRRTNIKKRLLYGFMASGGHVEERGRVKSKSWRVRVRVEGKGKGWRVRVRVEGEDEGGG